MTIAYENNPEDAAATQVFRIFGLPPTKIPMRVARIVFAGASCLMLLLLLVSVVSGLRTPFISPLLFLMLFYNLIFSPFFYRLQFYQQAKLKKTPPTFRLDLGRRTVSIRPDGLFVSLDGLSDTLIKWEAISEVAVEKKHIFIAWGGIQIVTIPRRAFADATQESMFLMESERHRLGLFAAPLMVPTNLTPQRAATTTTTAPESNAPWWTSQTPLTEEKPTINVNRGNG